MTSYSYDNVSRPTQIAHDLSGTSYDETLGMSYDPAGGIVSRTSSNDAYAWGGHYAVTRSYTTNGRNQYTASGSVTPTYDGNGNLSSAGGPTYAYNAENRLVTSTSGSVHQELIDDSLDRLFRYYDGSANRWFVYDGQEMIAEMDSAGTATVRRYVFGPGGDEPLVWYEGSGTSTRRFLHADERGSVVGVSDSSGAMYAINSYDEYGIPASSNTGRFQYTGQAWLAELGMSYYRNRIYSPTLGRFLQTDPIGFGGGMNIYAYVLNDPVNLSDPLGLDPPRRPPCSWCGGPTGTVTGHRTGSIAWLTLVGVAGVHVDEVPSDGGSEGEGSPPPSTPTCQAIDQHVDSTKGNLPSSIADTWRWDRIDALQNDLVTARMNLADANAVAWILSLGNAPAALGGARGGASPGVRGTAITIIAQLAASAGVSWSQSWAQRQIEALQARITQLQAKADGTCP